MLSAVDPAANTCSGIDPSRKVGVVGAWLPIGRDVTPSSVVNARPRDGLRQETSQPRPTGASVAVDGAGQAILGDTT